MDLYVLVPTLLSPLGVTAMVCTLCVAGIAAIYAVWLRKPKAEQSAQTQQK